MNNTPRILLLIGSLFFAATASAVPTLQLNIEGGFYDTTTETIVTASDVFTLDALAKKSDFDLILDQPVYLAVAITPKQEETLTDFGSFSVDGTSYSIGDLVYGTPPVENAEAVFDGGDLGKHGIYDTFFLELEFFFSSSLTVTSFNTQDDAGMTPDTSGDDLYLKQFAIDSSGLLAGFELHFDLYNTHVKNSRRCPDPQDCDFDINDFAPFSHDAGTVSSIPEPVPLALLGVGLVALGYSRKFSRI